MTHDARPLLASIAAPTLAMAANTTADPMYARDASGTVITTAWCRVSGTCQRKHQRSQQRNPPSPAARRNDDRMVFHKRSLPTCRGANCAGETVALLGEAQSRPALVEPRLAAQSLGGRVFDVVAHTHRRRMRCHPISWRLQAIAGHPAVTPLAASDLVIDCTVESCCTRVRTGVGWRNVC